MEGLSEHIRDNKPGISASTLKTYISILKNLYKRGDGEDGVKWFNKQAVICEMLKDKPLSTRKTSYAALIAAASDNDKYKEELMKDSKEYDRIIRQQKKSATQEANWEDYDAVRKLYEDTYARVKPLLKQTDPLNKKDFETVQDFVILSLTSGYWVPPRRNLDWLAMRIRNPDKTKENYIEKGHFIFQTYKTSKYCKDQKVLIPRGLKAIINKWIKLNTSDNMLVGDSTDGPRPMTGPRLTQRLNKLFGGKKIGTSMLRHIYLSDKLKAVPALLEMEKTAEEMGHSVEEALQYVKK